MNLPFDQSEHSTISRKFRAKPKDAKEKVIFVFISPINSVLCEGIGRRRDLLCLGEEYFVWIP